jgi:hypothetical protein
VNRDALPDTRCELRLLVALGLIVGSIDDDIHVDSARGRGGECITNLQVAEVADPSRISDRAALIAWMMGARPAYGSMKSEGA